jgi:hypothetical protein
MQSIILCAVATLGMLVVMTFCLGITYVISKVSIGLTPIVAVNAVCYLVFNRDPMDVSAPSVAEIIAEVGLVASLVMVNLLSWHGGLEHALRE